MDATAIDYNNVKYYDGEDGDASIFNRPIEAIINGYNTLVNDVSNIDGGSVRVDADNDFTGNNTFEGTTLVQGTSTFEGSAQFNTLRVNKKIFNVSSDLDSVEYLELTGTSTEPLIRLFSKYDDGNGSIVGSVVFDTPDVKIDRIIPNNNSFINLGSEVQVDKIYSSSDDINFSSNLEVGIASETKDILLSGDLKVNTDNFVIDGATGNTSIKGTLGVEDEATFTTIDVSGALKTDDILYTDSINSFTTDQEITILGSTKIGTDTDNKDLTVTGEITESSDARLKENVETITGALDIVGNMRGVYYNKIGSNKKEIGFIAQEVEDFLPEIVENGEEYKSVAYARTVAILVQSIKELTERVKYLEEK